MNKKDKEVDKMKQSMLGDGDAEAFSSLPAAGMPVHKVASLVKRLKESEDGLRSAAADWRVREPVAPAALCRAGAVAFAHQAGRREERVDAAAAAAKAAGVYRRQS
mgnify:CR=1 FL=1